MIKIVEFLDNLYNLEILYFSLQNTNISNIEANVVISYLLNKFNQAKIYLDLRDNKINNYQKWKLLIS